VLVADPGFTNALGIVKDKSAQGSLMSIFLVCYGLSNFLAGPIVYRFGSKRALQVGILCWAVLMALMGAVSSIVVMLICRALLGVGESMLMPGVAALTQAWFPKKERSTANGIWYSGMKVAQIIATPVLAWWIYAVGWRGSFYILAVVGLIPIALTIYHVHDHPSKSPRISKEEADYIISGGGTGAVSRAKMDFSFVKLPAFWYITGVFAIANAGIWGFTTWVPSYLKATLGFSWAQMGALAGLPFIAATVWVLVFTPLMDKLNRRALIVLICLAFFAAALVIAMNTGSRMFAVAVLSLALAFIAVTVPAAFVMVQNITTQNQVATATGMMNGVSYVFASIAPYGMGFLYDWTGTLKSGFLGLSAMVVVAFFLCIPLVRQRL
jgi:sugar phosphate permease